MGGLPETAAIMLSQAQRRIEVAAENVANMSTPGYKRQVSFAAMLPVNAGAYETSARLDYFVDASNGQQVNSGNATDLYITGTGYFAVSDGDRTLFTRQGQFVRDADGRLSTAQGYKLQAADGGDLVLKPGSFEVAADGTVTQAGLPAGRIALLDFPVGARLVESGGMLAVDSGAGGGGEMAPASAQLRQGAYEASNVSTGEEMVTMMESLRRAESAQRLVTLYDELMGRALTAFGGQG